MFKIGEKVKVKIIEIKDDKISLSIKALKENPWREAEKKYHKDDLYTFPTVSVLGKLESIDHMLRGENLSQVQADAVLYRLAVVNRTILECVLGPVQTKPTPAPTRPGAKG